LTTETFVPLGYHMNFIALCSMIRFLVDSAPERVLTNRLERDP